MPSPLVSVIIPAYNGDRFIVEAVESVLKQTYRNVEIIVVNDGSTDGTAQKLHLYGNKIRYLSQSNQGSASARNTGIKAAQGKLIAFLDADDFFLIPEKLEEQVNYFNDRPSLGSLYTGWRQINQDGVTVLDVEPWHQAPILDLETWLVWKPIRTSSMMIRHYWLEKVNGFDPELRQSHDVDLVLRLALAGCEADWLRKITVCYRQHQSNTTRNAPVQAKSILLVLDKFFSNTNLPQRILEKENQIRYNTLVWVAWHQYHTGYTSEMVKYLQRATCYTPYLRTETVLDWVNKFAKFSSDQNSKLNIDSLTNLLEWQQVINHFK